MAPKQALMFWDGLNLVCETDNFPCIDSTHWFPYSTQNTGILTVYSDAVFASRGATTAMRMSHSHVERSRIYNMCQHRTLCFSGVVVVVGATGAHHHHHACTCMDSLLSDYVQQPVSWRGEREDEFPQACCVQRTQSNHILLCMYGTLQYIPTALPHQLQQHTWYASHCRRARENEYVLKLISVISSRYIIARFVQRGTSSTGSGNEPFLFIEVRQKS